MKKLNYIFIGGKQLGYNCLNFLLKKNNKPIFLVPNLDDDGNDNDFNKSLRKLGKKNRIDIISLKRLNKQIKKKKIDVDIIFCLGSSQIIPKNILENSRLGALNIHPSLLPKYRGRYSIPRAIFCGEKFSGISVHWIGKKVDTGKVISQVRIKINKEDTAETIYKKFTSVASFEFKRLYPKIIKNVKFKYKNINFKSSKYKKKSLPNNGNINWSWSGEKILRFIRSMLHEPFPPPKFNIGRKKYFIVSESYLNKNKFLKSPK
tara:strand:+ start:687 stop:1472 length:786 start_codon:yes stop_codon:yes gene_type:complete